MAKHRAVIIGAGRIGAGYQWPEHPFVYTHADAYLKLQDRVQLMGFVDPDPVRCQAAAAKYKVPAYAGYESAYEECDPDIVSVCVHPEARRGVFQDVTPYRDSIKGVWCEKPWTLEFPKAPLDPNLKIQVNYIRRFDTLHQMARGEILSGELGEIVEMVVMAKDDQHTSCHFWDLAQWWGILPERVTYVGLKGLEYVNTEYEVIGTKGKMRFYQGGMSATKFMTQESRWFPGAKVPHTKGQIAAGEPKVFMERALGNLLDAVEGKAELLSPPY